MAGPLAQEASAIVRELARSADVGGLRERVANARGLAKKGSLTEKALAGAAALLAGFEDLAPAERFERLDLALDAVSAVAAESESSELVLAIERRLGPPAAASALPVTEVRPKAVAADLDPLEAIELLSGEIVQVSGATDAAGFASVEHAARELHARVMKTGGGDHPLLDAVSALADLAGRASRGEVPPSVDTRAVLSAAASALPRAVKGDSSAAIKIEQQIRSAGGAPPEVTDPDAPTIMQRGPLIPRNLARTGEVVPAPQVPLDTAVPAGRRTVKLALGGDRAILDGFVVEAREHLTNAEGRLLALEENPRDATVVNDLFRAFHSIKGVAGLLGLAPVVQLTHALESLLDAARKGTRVIDRTSIDALLAARDTLHASVDSVASSLERQHNEAEMADPEPLVATLEAILAGRPVPADAEETRLDQRTPPAGVSTPRVTQRPPAAPAAARPLDTPPTALQRPPAPGPGPAMTFAAAPLSGSGGGAAAHSGVRVPMERLDALVALVGEMVISQAQVGHDLAGSGDPDAPVVKETNRLGKITREVQDLSMTLRMLPVQPLFQKLQRLVRDLVRMTGKSIRLETDGEETRLDKSVIDELEDPLVHMVRNAVDHGLEAADERRKTGKPEQGVIRVSARHAAGEVVIEIQDDGKGLDKERILAKAREKGLAPQDETPSEGTIFGYIFEPGLSTAQKVTELSGRGVGMDVVKRNILKLRGKIDIDSRRGQGTRFTVRLPLTLAIIDGMIVRVGEERFTLPNFAIEEALQLKAGQLLTAYGKGEMVRIRGQLAPFVRLRDVFHLPGAAEPESICVVVEAAGERVALGVDEIVGQQQIVIKSLEPPFNEVPAVGGATVLGDGRVGLILDVAKLVALALGADGAAAPAERDPEPAPPRREGSLEGKYLTVALGDEEYGLPVLDVQEIVTALPTTRIPLVPSFVTGAVNLRGHVIPVVDLRVRLGMKPLPPTSESCIVVVRLSARTVGLLVDSVREVIFLRRDATAAPPRLDPRLRADFILGVGSAGDRVAFLLDTERVLAARELIETKRGPQ